MQMNMNRLENITSKLELLNPTAQLQRGYALAVDKNNKVIISPDQVEINDKFQLQIASGQLTAKVLDKGN
jgi:exonuclease VII large subunit